MFFNSHVSVLRKLPSGYDEDGNWKDSEEIKTTIIANVQPLNQRESDQYTQVLGFGNRTVRMVKIYTNADLVLDTQMRGDKADVVVWLGRKYKVAMQEEWQSNIISHYRYIGVEVVGDEFPSEEVHPRFDC